MPGVELAHDLSAGFVEGFMGQQNIAVNAGAKPLMMQIVVFLLAHTGDAALHSSH